MRWDQARAEIDKLIADGELQRVPPNREHPPRARMRPRRACSWEADPPRNTVG